MSVSWPVKSLQELIDENIIELGRGKVISKKDLLRSPGEYPVYSSAKNNEGKFGEYGKYMFDEELITWSVDGGGRLFYRPKHKFSITNVGGYVRIKKPEQILYRFLYYRLSSLHSSIEFDWVKKAHPSVIRKLYKEIPLPPLSEQKRIVAILDEAFAGIATTVTNTEKNLANARELFESYTDGLFDQLRKAGSEKRLEDICTFSSGGTPSKRESRYWIGEIPWVSGRDMKSMQLFDSTLHISQSAIDESATRLAAVGSLLMLVRGMGLAHGAQVAELISPCAFNQDIKAIHPESGIVPRYLVFALAIA